MTSCHICKNEDHSFKDCPNRYQVFRFGTGRWVTTGIFLETYQSHLTPKSRVIYTLLPYSLDQYPSLHQLYLTYEDLTEYQFASECLGGWDHWQTILGSENERLQDAIKVWRAELEIKLKSQAFQRIKEEAEADGRNGFAANRYLIERSWAGDFSKPKPQEKNSRGRPSKQSIQDAAAAIALDNKQVNDDFDRMFTNGDHEERPDTTSGAE
jgi:hypothetical protein